MVMSLCLLAAGTARAELVRGLYEAEVPVTEQSAGERRGALTAALAMVLVKVSGNRAIATDPAVADALLKPARFVQQYRYRVVEPPAEPQGGPGPVENRSGGPAGEPPESQLILSVRFDATAVNELLRTAGQRIWGEARPTTLVWLAVEEGGRRRLVGASDKGPVTAALKERAAQRGLPLHLPLLDLQDQLRLEPVDVWGGFRDPILAASTRYQSQAVLVGRLSQDTPGMYQVQWSLYLGRETLRWESAGSVLEAVLGVGVDGAADVLSQRFAQTYTATGGATLAVQVRDITSLDGYARAMDYLRELNGVKGVQVVMVSPGSVSFRLELTGERQAVIQAISLGDTLVPDSNGGEEWGRHPVAAEAEHVYRLLP